MGRVSTPHFETAVRLKRNGKKTVLVQKKIEGEWRVIGKHKKERNALMQLEAELCLF